MENRVTHQLISTRNPGTWNYAIPKATVRPGPSQEETPRACSRRDRRDSAPSHSHFSTPQNSQSSWRSCCKAVGREGSWEHQPWSLLLLLPFQESQVWECQARKSPGGNKAQIPKQEIGCSTYFQQCLASNGTKTPGFGKNILKIEEKKGYSCYLLKWECI